MLAPQFILLGFLAFHNVPSTNASRTIPFFQSNSDTTKATLRMLEKPAVFATFPGGRKKFERFVKKNINQDLIAKNGASKGTYTLEIGFIVEDDGHVKSVAPFNSPGFGMMEEAARVILLSPTWNPAKNSKGQPIASLVSDFSFTYHIK